MDQRCNALEAPLENELAFFGGFIECYSQTARGEERREILKNKRESLKSKREILKNKREILKNKREILQNKPIPCEREGISLSPSASRSILPIPGCRQHKGGSWSRESSYEAAHHPEMKEAFFSPGLALARPSVCPAGRAGGVWVCFSSSLP